MQTAMSQIWQKIIGNKTYTVFFLALMFFSGLGGTYFTLTALGREKTIPKNIQAKILENENPTPIPEPINISDSFNVVLLGSGGSGHSGGSLTDSIIVVSIDTKTKRAAMFSVPRDLWVPGNRKINASVLAHGPDNLRGELKNITGLNIDKYASIDFAGLTRLIDSIGGIEVDIPKAFNDNFYPVRGLENELCGKTADEVAELHKKYSGFQLEKQFTCRYEQINFEKGKVEVNGETALKLARSRHGDSDFGRSERQFAILKGILAKTISRGGWEMVESTYLELSKFVKTDLNVTQAIELVKVLGIPESYDVVSFNISEDNVLKSSQSSDGQYILIPKAGNFDYSEVRNFVSK
jgi:polyisoprenyl-teichoic acid--peptidoglycan teichoic acid transferase